MTECPAMRHHIIYHKLAMYSEFRDNH